MAEGGKGGQVMVAVIGAASALGVALVANWRNIFPEHAPTAPPPASIAPPNATPAVAQSAAAPGPTPVAAAPTPGPAVSISAATASAPASDFIFPDSSERPLTVSEVAALPADKLRIARNEIYARHGHVFQSPDLRAWFSRFSWYHPVVAPLALSPVEQANVAMLQQAESAHAGGG